jgi:guanidinobutyrase
MKTLARCLAAALLTGLVAVTATAQEIKVEKPPVKVEIPASLAPKLKKLPKEKLDFLLSEKTHGFAARPELLFKRFETKTPKEIEAYIDGMMSVVEQSKFHPGKDEASIALNTETEGFNGWKVKRPTAFDTPRAPGPINLNRYMGAGPKLGIPTFFNLPAALTPEDLKAGKVDVAIVGAGLDMGSGFRGAAYGPRAVRTGEVYKGQGMVTPENMHVMVSPFNELNVVDYGDIAVDQLSTERSVEHIREVVREIAAAGSIPMIVGGDHSLMYPDAAGVVDVYGKGKVGIVHFDAHYDAGKDEAHLLSHGQPVYRLIREQLVPGKNFIQVGLRGYWPNKESFEWMRENGFRYHPMAEVEKSGWDAVMTRAITEAREGPEYIFVSFDIDSLDPAFMPGTGTPEPGGLTMREALPVVRRLCAETKVVGFELVELDPLVDPGYTTALNSNRILRECLTGIAMHKLGMTQEHYLSPLTTEHAQGKYQKE